MTWLPDLWVAAGLLMVGATSGALGCFALLRRQSLLGDALAHAALPGVCLAYLVTHQKEPWVLLVGALGAGLVGTGFVVLMPRTSRLKTDTSLGLVLSTFFAMGVLLLVTIQRRRDLEPSGLDRYIYGQAATLGPEHVVLMVPFGLLALLAVALLYKELKLVSFDPQLATTLGYSSRWLEVVLSCLIVLGVIISLRAIGVVLTTALLIMPAAAARQWTNRLSVMLFVAMGIGMASGLGGAYWSENAAQTPTGPAVVLVATGFLGVSLLLAPRRGLLWHWLRLQAHRRTVRRENLLSDFYRLGERDGDWQRPRPLAELAAVRGQPARPLRSVVGELQARGLVRAAAPAGAWQLTPGGQEEAARVVRNHRLWELYLTRRLDLPSDHVHRDAEEMEHALPAETVRELEALLDHPQIDPHGKPLPPASESLSGAAKGTVPLHSGGQSPLPPRTDSERA